MQKKKDRPLKQRETMDEAAMAITEAAEKLGFTYSLILSDESGDIIAMAIGYPDVLEEMKSCHDDIYEFEILEKCDPDLTPEEYDA
jgi:hypothetical protein